MSFRALLCCLLICLASPAMAAAPFDLSGPSLQVSVRHGDLTLPISEAPNLAVGDLLTIRADLPPSESARYLLIAAFLRGATNPPPRSWFHKVETWTSKGSKGLVLSVPEGAQQVVVFLAPQTGGDFKTLVDAVRSRPGVFVRASQDLNQAALDRSRLDAFLAALKKRKPGDPDSLKTVSALLARSLTIKLDTDCFQRMPELQAACLMQGQDSLVLDDGHSTSIVGALTSGASADLAMELSAAPQAGFGFYSPYVAAVIDIARILDSLGTAHYQYIPALARPEGDHLDLLLNAPPSFHSPLSVLVTALPAVEPPQPPPLQPVDPDQTYCVERTDLVLPVEGAPLVYSTRYAHDMTLRVKARNGSPLDLPVRADAERGGFIADTAGVDPASLSDTIDGQLRGYWGFQPFDGPKFRLQNVHAQPWRLADADQGAPVVGRDDTVRLRGQDAACVADVALRWPSGAIEPVAWKPTGPNELAVTLPLAQARPGDLTLLVTQYGMKNPDAAPVTAFAEAGRLTGFTLHAGDASGVLTGTRLDEVAALNIAGVLFKPGALTSSGGEDQLAFVADDASAAAALRAGQIATAKVTLKDGRTAHLRVDIAAARPKVALIGTSVAADQAAGAIPVELGDQDEMPQTARLTFSVRADAPTSLSDGPVVQVATDDGAASTTLTATNGLTREDAHVVVATMDPAKALGAAASGALKFRLIDDGAASDWQPLVKLVRLPVIRELKCQSGRASPCELVGSDLFLIQSISSNETFDHAVEVPEGFPGAAIPTPHPVADRLFVRLRDDPTATARLVLPARPTAAALEKELNQRAPRAGDHTGTTTDHRHEGSNQDRTSGPKTNAV